MMAAHAAILGEFDDSVLAPGSRRDRAAPGPSQRRESEEDPTDHGRWWQDRHNRGGSKGAAKGKSKGGSQSYGGGSGVFRSPPRTGGGYWPTSRGWEWKNSPWRSTFHCDVDDMPKVLLHAPHPAPMFPRKGRAPPVPYTGMGGVVIFAVRSVNLRIGGHEPTHVDFAVLRCRVIVDTLFMWGRSHGRLPVFLLLVASAESETFVTCVHDL